MTDSPKQTARSSVSSPPTRTSWSESRPALYALLAADVALLVVAFYLLQEGLAQRQNPHVTFFVEFPDWLTYPISIAIVLLLPNLAVGFFVILRRLPVRRWFYVTTLLAAVLIGITVGVVGPANVPTIINPNW